MWWWVGGVPLRSQERVSCSSPPPHGHPGTLAPGCAARRCRCCEGSLERLGLQRIDLFTLRGPLGPSVQLEDTMRALKVSVVGLLWAAACRLPWEWRVSRRKLSQAQLERATAPFPLSHTQVSGPPPPTPLPPTPTTPLQALVEEGKVRGVGLSEVSADEIRRAHAIVPIAAVELEWSLFSRDAEVRGGGQPSHCWLVGGSQLDSCICCVCVCVVAGGYCASGEAVRAGPLSCPEPPSVHKSTPPPSPHPRTTSAQVELVPTCRELGIGLLAYSPLCRGLLSQRFAGAGDIAPADFWAAHMPRFAGPALQHNLALAAGSVVALAARKGCTPGQVALAWLLSKGDDIIPIPGGWVGCR